MHRRIESAIIVAAVAAFAWVAVTGTGGWGLLIATALVAFGLVDGCCRSLDRHSDRSMRWVNGSTGAAFVVATPPLIEVVAPAPALSDQPA